MNEKSVSRPNKPKNKTIEPTTRDRQRGIVVAELLFAAATLGTAVLVAAMSPPKQPPVQGD
jgi:hypothetical protein